MKKTGLIVLLLLCYGCAAEVQENPRSTVDPEPMISSTPDTVSGDTYFEENPKLEMPSSYVVNGKKIRLTIVSVCLKVNPFF